MPLATSASKAHATSRNAFAPVFTVCGRLSLE
jgi:hypothetical protein